MKKRGVKGNFLIGQSEFSGENGEGRNMAACHVTVES